MATEATEEKLPGEGAPQDTSRDALENSAASLEAASKTTTLEREWTVNSSLQVLGGFFLLFNTYCRI
jgi:hypothetical protein